MNKIRNFCIIAHIDHGKSTLADRFLELTGTIPKNKMKEQVLDRLDLERERGITIKLQPVRMQYQGYELNLIDTPGHVDFTYEVSRSLAACEGALLLVDVTQGIQAQTLANLYLALAQGLKIIPVVNKIDLPNAEVKKTVKEMSHLLGVPANEVIQVSAKTGSNVKSVLQEVIKSVPAPTGQVAKPARALIFDSFFDEYRGVVAYVRVFDGQFKAGDKIDLLGTNKSSEVMELGFLSPDLKSCADLQAGEIGYIVTGLKEVAACRVGDTIAPSGSSLEALPGYKEVKSMVFAGIFCKEGHNYGKLREAVEQLRLQDAAFNFEPFQAAALGFGFRCGFLGLLHLEIISERLKREFDLDLITTVPTVAYHVSLTNGKKPTITSAQDWPDPSQIKAVEEPWTKVDIVSPTTYLGGIMQLVQENKGVYKNTEYLDKERAILHYQIPLSFLLVDFYDKLKSVSQGYASLNYEFLEYRPTQVVKMDIVVAEEKIEALSIIVYQNEAYRTGRVITKKLSDSLPRQLFEIKIQAALGGKVIASERISPMRKDVTAKLYGGDVTRKMKLLKKQKKGKKRMQQQGKINIPPEAYLAVLKR
ncbi:MAG: translation elongation factor 4 [Patescibacteria group bacterium]